MNSVAERQRIVVAPFLVLDVQQTAKLKSQT